MLDEDGQLLMWVSSWPVRLEGRSKVAELRGRFA